MDTPISTRAGISIWWSRRYRVYDITVRALTQDPGQGALSGLRESEVLYHQTYTYREARTYRWMILNARRQREESRRLEGATMTQSDEALEMMQCAHCGGCSGTEVLCARCEEEATREEEEAMSRYSAAMTEQARWEDARRWERAQEGRGR